jgi:hypothetical protein
MMKRLNGRRGQAGMKNPALIADKKENVYLVFTASELHPYFGDLRCS